MKTGNRIKRHDLLEMIWAAGRERGMTPRQVAKAAGYHPNQVVQFTNPTIGTLERLADVVGGKIEFAAGKFVK